MLVCTLTPSMEGLTGPERALVANILEQVCMCDLWLTCSFVCAGVVKAGGGGRC